MAKTTITVPSLSEISSAYSALQSRKGTLQLQKQRLDREADDQRFAQTNFRPDGGRSARVGALLGDDIAEIVDPATRLKEIAIEIADVEAAIREINARMSAERNVASKAITERVRPAYTELVGNLARSLIAAHIANRDLCVVISDLNAADVAWVGALPPMQAVRVLGAPNDNQGALARYLNEAAALGVIKASEIPPELKA